MNAFTLYLIGRNFGKKAFEAGNPCIPTSDFSLMERMKHSSTAAQKQLMQGWTEGWRGSELDNGGR